MNKCLLIGCVLSDCNGETKDELIDCCSINNSCIEHCQADSECLDGLVCGKGETNTCGEDFPWSGAACCTTKSSLHTPKKQNPDEG